MNQACEVIHIPYRCPNCSAKVGDLVDVEGKPRLDDGVWLVAEARRYCHRCGRIINFKAPKESWGELVERHKRLSAVSSQHPLQGAEASSARGEGG